MDLPANQRVSADFWKVGNFENSLQTCYFVFPITIDFFTPMSSLYEKMLRDLLHREEIELTMDQDKVVEEFMEFFEYPMSKAVMVLRGAAGTGKTFMIRLLTWFLLRQGYKVALLAPTGRAAKVITKRTRRYASTIHRHIYSPAESATGSIFFTLKENKDPIKIFYIVDEASMVGDGEKGGRGLLADLFKFVYTEYPQRKIIMVGDPAQLPPVGSTSSPALEPAYLEKEFGLAVFQANMTQVMRQGETSEVLRWANLVREAMDINTIPYPELAYGGEVELLENGHEALELYVGLYREDDPDAILFVTYSNKVAVDVNVAIRHLLFEPTEDLLPGELLMVVRNNYAWGTDEFPFIANGEMGVVREVHMETYEERYGLRFVDVELEFMNVADRPVEISCKIMLDLLTDKRAQIGFQQMQNLARIRREEYMHLPKTRAGHLFRKDPYLHALQVKYGYAVTGHKAQGGQWRNVIVGFEPMYKGMEMSDYLRWSYTAMTRAEERLFLLNCPYVQREW